MTAPVQLGLSSQPAGAITSTGLEDHVHDPQGPTAAEIVTAAPGLSVMDSLVSGGFHPEHVIVPVTTALSRATDSLRGPLGGLIPQGTGSQANGPAAAAAHITAQASAALGKADTWLQRARRRVNGG